MNDIPTIDDLTRIPDTCQERFLPLHSRALASLRARGLDLAGISRLRRGYRIGRRDASFHMVAFTLAGSVSIQTPTLHTIVEPGSLFVAPAHLPYTFAPGGEQWDMLWFHLDDIPLWAHLRAEQIQLRPAYLTDKLMEAVEGLLGEHHLGEADSPTAMEHFAGLISVYLDRELRPDTAPHERQQRQAIQELWNTVSGSLHHPWDVAGLARRLNMSSSHFHRLVVRYTGKRPMETVTRLRMERARELLLHEALPLKTIAERVGYESAFSFSAAFKRFSGVSPQEFRARHLTAGPSA